MTSTLSQAIQAAVVASPGITMRQIAEALGRTDRATTTVMSARLTQLCKVGKLRGERVQAPGRASWRYFPTAQTGTDNRRLTPQASDMRRTEAQRKAEYRKRKAEAAAAGASYSSAKASKPKPASHIRIVALPHPPTVPRGRAQTVEEFLAQRGRIEKLGPYASSNPLRFDYSRAECSSTRRRGAACHRKASAL